MKSEILEYKAATSIRRSRNSSPGGPLYQYELTCDNRKNYEIKIVWPRKLSSLTKNRTWVQNYGKNITKKNDPRSDTIVGLAEMEGMIH